MEVNKFQILLIMSPFIFNMFKSRYVMYYKKCKKTNMDDTGG